MKNKKVIINNFRNIFMPTEEIKNSKEQNGNVLILSHNANQGSIVTLIGPNNVGKSNILDAIYCDNKSLFLNKPDWEYLWNESNHKTSVIINDSSIEEHNLKIIDSILNKLNFSDKTSEYYIEFDEIRKSFNQLSEYNELSKLLTQQNFNSFQINKYFMSSYSKKEEIIILLFFLLHLNMVNLCGGTYEKFVNDIIYFISQYQNNAIHHGYRTPIYAVLGIGATNNEKNFPEMVKYLYKRFSDYFEKIPMPLNKILLDLNYGEKPKIMRFDNKDIIKATSLEFDLNNQSSFQEKLKNIIDVNDEYFKSILNLINSNQPESIISGHIDNIISKLNNEINEKISNKFNDLYFLRQEKYEFKIQRLNTYTRYAFKISLIKNNGENIILNLDKQSEGFKWFFNFYFQIIMDIKFNQGLIVLLEEPAVNLHIEAQKQWLKFIREFAYKNKITFVMTTHSPFLVDCDHLDEIRVIYKDGEFSKINNYFSIDVGTENKNTLQILIDSFTWQNIISTLIDKNDQLILVEGITDYIYLNHFKSKLKEYDNLHFLPINGLGKMKEIPNVIKNVINYFGSNSFILIDNDKVGQEFEKSVKDKKTDIKVIKINETNPSFKVMEDLFSKNDIIKFNYIKEKKTSKIIGLCNSLEEVFDEETKSNFIKLLNNIKNRL